MKAKLILPDGRTIDLPVKTGAEGLALDLSDLPAGVMTYDPQLSRTGVKEDWMCFIDGEKGELYYSGIPIQELVKGDLHFQEIALLLRDGNLPTDAETQQFSWDLNAHSTALPFVWTMLNNMPEGTKPMAMLASVLPLLDEDWGDLTKLENRLKLLPTAMAKMAVVVAMIHRKVTGCNDYIKPRKDLGYVNNFLYMCHGEEPDDKLVEFFHLFAILHAEHGMNGSTTATMVTGGTLAMPFASLASGVNALAGARHGGANQDVAILFLELVKEGISAEAIIARATDKATGFKVPGIGHNVYKAFDPRAGVFKAMAERELGGSGDPVVALGFKTYELVRETPYFVDRNLYANVDFFSAFLLLARGVPVEMFPVLFALFRTVGWTLHWAHVGKLIRPRSLYVGELKAEA